MFFQITALRSKARPAQFGLLLLQIFRGQGAKRLSGSLGGLFGFRGGLLFFDLRVDAL